MQIMLWVFALGCCIPGQHTKYVSRTKVIQARQAIGEPDKFYGYRNQIHGPLIPNKPPIPPKGLARQGNQRVNETRSSRDTNTNIPSNPPKREEKLLFDGLDCRSPTSVRNGLVADICKGEKAMDPVGQAEPVVILQHDTKRVAKAYRCRKRVSRLQEVCGAFSHSKILGPPDILEPVPFSALDCQQTIKRGLYRTETGSSVTVDINREYNYKFIAHGQIHVSTTNVACEGSSIIINGERHESVVTLVTAHLEFLEVDVEIDNDSAVDLDLNIKLPTDCVRRDLCEDGNTAYVILHPASTCPLFIIRTVNMLKISLKTNKGTQQAFMNKEHKLLLIIKPSEATDNGCTPLRSVGGTQYPNLKILHSDNTPAAEMRRVVSRLGPSQLDLTLEIITADEFLDYDLEQRMDQQLRAVGSSLCTMSRQSLHQTELSPFHKDSLIRIRGAIVSELQCEKVLVEARLGDKRGSHCYKDSLPVWVRNAPVHMLAVSGLIVEENTLTHIPCKNQFNSVFRTRNGIMVQADPEVQIITDLQLQHIGSGYMHALDNSNAVHTEYDSDLLYNNEQVGAFNNLLHFNRAKAHVLDSLVRQYCKTGTDGASKCGEYIPDDPGINGFDLGQLEREIVAKTDWVRYAQNKLTEYGGYCSIGVVIYVVLQFLYKLASMCFGTCFRQEDWVLSARRNFFTCSQLNHKMERESRKQGREMDTYSDTNTEATYVGRDDTVTFLDQPIIRHERLRSFKDRRSPPLPSRICPRPTRAKGPTGSPTPSKASTQKPPRYEQHPESAPLSSEELQEEGRTNARDGYSNIYPDPGTDAWQNRERPT
jgi:hypothetical protein